MTPGVSMSAANGTHDLTDSMTFASRPTSDRRADALKQTRDRFGRWVTEGANVQWRELDRDYAGTIESIENGQAVVIVKNTGGEETLRKTLSPKDLKVTSSKATLNFDDIPSSSNETVKQSVENPSFKQDLEVKGAAGVKREDGYAIEAVKKAEIGGNPILYKLYAPGGRSLGEYDEQAVESFEDMINEDKQQGPRTTDENGDIIPMSPDSLLPGGPVAASASVIRVARDNTSVIVQDNTVFKIIDLSTGKEFLKSNRLDTLLASGSWRKAVGTEKELSTHIPEQNDIEIEIRSLAQYRVPANVKETILASVTAVNALELSKEDRKHINSLAHDDLVTLDSISWINKFFAEHEKPENIHGGYAGKKWAAKIITKEDSTGTELDIINNDDNKYSNFDDDTFVYLGIGHDTSSGTTVSELFSVDLETDSIYKWNQGEFTLQDFKMNDVDAPVIVVVDALSAQTIARWIDVADSTPALDVLDIDPEERNLFTLAAGDLDFEEMDRVFTIIADATGYTPAERSVNAQRQKRGAGGKFGGEQVPQSSTLTDGVTKKASLPQELPLIENIGQYIQQWLETAGDFAAPAEETVTAAGVGGTVLELEAEGEAAPTSAPTEEPATTEEAPATENILYFAIVDPVDKTAVIDALALIKQNGGPVAWVRSGGSWVKSPEKLSDLQGATPPPVVKLDIPEPVKTVLTQIDSHDQEKGVSTQEMPIAASEFSLFDQTLTIANADDLVKSVFTASELPESDYLIFAKNHIRKRARALNRMDLVPLEWREASIAEIGTVEYNTSPLFGEYGEVISQFKDYSPKQRENDSDKGYAMPSGSYPIRTVADLKNAIKAFGRAKDSEKEAVKKHIIKRAKVLGHPELIPNNWKSVTAGGVPGIADTPGDFKNTERLMNYWAFGKGAAKIRWGTPGDLTRAHRHLVKYVGPMRAWGLAQNLHKRVMGVPNITHDRATGQYRGRGRK